MPVLYTPVIIRLDEVVTCVYFNLSVLAVLLLRIVSKDVSYVAPKLRQTLHVTLLSRKYQVPGISTCVTAFIAK